MQKFATIGNASSFGSNRGMEAKSAEDGLMRASGHGGRGIGPGEQSEQGHTWGRLEPGFQVVPTSVSKSP